MLWLHQKLPIPKPMDSFLPEPIPKRPLDDLMKYFGELFKERMFTDVLLHSGNGMSIAVHKLLLSYHSKTFEQMFKSKDVRVVMFKHIDFQAMHKFVTYLYYDEILELSKSVFQLLLTAIQYDLPKLKSICERQIVFSLTDQNLIQTLVEAETWKFEDIKQACWNFIRQ
jgi:hypothetical protein